MSWILIGKNILTSAVIITCIGIVYGTQISNDPVNCDSKPPISSFTVILGTFCGWISGLFYFFSRIPQIIENQKFKSVEGLSFGLFTLTIAGNLSYGLSILIRTPTLDEHFYFQ